MNNTVQAYKDMHEGNLDNFDKAYNKWHDATVKLTRVFEKAATDKRAIDKFKKALQTLESAIDAGAMRD